MSRELPEVCSIISPHLLDIIYAGIEKLPVDTNRIKLDDSAYELASVCGYQLSEGKWVKFPKQKETLERLTHAGIPDTYKVIEEHGDGDLTIQLAKQGKAIVTTDGEIYYYSQHVRV